LAEIGRSYNVSHSTISRLAPANAGSDQIAQNRQQGLDRLLIECAVTCGTDRVTFIKYVLG
jgi:hypothetical protein